MASIRLRYQQPKGASDNQAEGRISIQITHKSRTRTINTGYGLLLTNGTDGVNAR